MAFLIFRVSLVITLFLSVVIPNSLQMVTAASLVISASFAALVLKKSQRLVRIFGVYGLTLFVTVTYLLLGVVEGATADAVFQVLTIYVVSPFLWILIAAAIESRLGLDRVPEWLGYLTVACVVSVCLFFFLFLNYGAASVSFFIETANVNLNDGYVGATMSVYGSFIFLAGAFFSSPTIIKNIPFRIFCLISILGVAVTSGRSAVILSIILGLLIFLVVRNKGRLRKNRGNGGAALLSVFIFALFAYFYFSEINLDFILQLFFEKIADGGGVERVEQAAALWDGIRETAGLGAGHGIGVDYVRSDVNPWRYELVWLATLFRVGIVGFLIYLLPAIIYFKRFYYFFKRRLLRDVDIFLFGGFFCAFLASNTNPYAEAFIFQWMYVLPFVFMMLKRE